jgi:hypothetical protein
MNAFDRPRAVGQSLAQALSQDGVEIFAVSHVYPSMNDLLNIPSGICPFPGCYPLHGCYTGAQIWLPYDLVRTSIPLTSMAYSEHMS